MVFGASVRWLVALLGILIILSGGETVNLPQGNMIQFQGEIVLFGQNSEMGFQPSFICPLRYLRGVKFYFDIDT